MHFNMTPPKEAPNQKPPMSRAELPTKIGRHVTRPRDLLYWLWTEQIVPYPKNRGGRNKKGDIRPAVAERTVKSVRHNFHGWSFAGATACVLSDDLRERYEVDSDSHLLLADGHGGTMGLFLRWWDGNMTDTDLDFPVVLTVAPPSEFLRIYTLRNIQVAQTAAQTLADDDLLYGNAIWNEIMPRVSEEAKDLLCSRPAKLLPQLSYVLEIWKHRNRGNGDWNYLTAFRARTETKPKSIQPADSFDLGLKSQDYDEIAEAVNWYAEFITRLDAIIADAGMGEKEMRKIKSSAPLFGLVLVDYLAEKPLVLPRDRKVGTMVNQTKRNMGDVATLLPMITHGDDLNIMKQIDRLGHTLKGRKG